MRTRALVVIALFALPAGLSGQGIRLPRSGRGTQPAPLPPEIPGTRGDFRLSQHFAATLDMTVSFLGTFATTETGEVGTRYWPLSRGETLRPYFDIRAAYTHMNDTYSIPTGGLQPIGGPTSQFSETGGYGHGLGAIAGAGFEYSLTNSLAVTTELLATRSNMTTSRLARGLNSPGSLAYHMTSLRYVLGLKYNPVQALHLVQKATP